MPYTKRVSRNKPNKLQIKTLHLRLASLRAELVDDLTERCGEAAKK